MPNKLPSKSSLSLTSQLFTPGVERFMSIASVGSFGAKAIEIYFWHFSLECHIYYTWGVHLNVMLHMFVYYILTIRPSITSQKDLR